MPNMRRRFWFRTVEWCLVVFFSCLLGSELYLSHLGYSLDYIDRQKEIVSSLVQDNEEAAWLWHCCGWGPQIGSRVSDEDPSVIETIWPNGMRECRPQVDKEALFKVAFVGCSYTYGEGLAAPQTWVYRLNQHYPKVQFDNYGIRGSGMISSYERIKWHLGRKKEKYDVVVFGAILGHLFRDPCVRVAGDLGKNQAYAVGPRLKKNIWGDWKIVYSDEHYWPGEDSLLTVDFLKRVYYGFQVYRAKKFEKSTHLQEYYKTYPDFWLYLVNLMQNECQKAGAKYVICILDNGMLFSKKPLPGFTLLQIDMPGSNKAVNRVLQNDQSHPNGKVHEYWAVEFSHWLDEYLSKHCPEAKPKEPMRFSQDI